MNAYNRNTLAKESGLQFDYVERVIRKMGLKSVGLDHHGRQTYDLVEFTAALEEYRHRVYKENEEKEGDTFAHLEDEKLREVIRGLRLKNDILANKLIDCKDVYNYIGEYISSELNRVKRLCLQQLVLKGRNKTSQEMRQLANELYNGYVLEQKEFVKKWMEKTKVDKEVTSNE